MLQKRIVVFTLCSALATYAQSSPPRQDPNALAAIAKAVATFSSAPVTQVHLDGTAHAIAGSINEVGTFAFDLQDTGESTLSINAGALTRIETNSGFKLKPACSWSGADKVSHQEAEHNCLLPLNWIIPLTGLGARLNKLALKNAENPGSSAVSISIGQPAVSGTKAALSYADLTTATISIDPSTSLPESLSYSLHPDNNELMDIPITIRYSDYRQLNGVAIPFHVQKYINNGLALDLIVNTANVQ